MDFVWFNGRKEAIHDDGDRRFFARDVFGE